MKVIPFLLLGATLCRILLLPSFLYSTSRKLRPMGGCSSVVSLAVFLTVAVTARAEVV